MIRTLLRLAAAATCAAAPATAPSRPPAPPGEPFAVAIPTRDLDLASPAGRAAFAARVEALATRSCAPRPFPAAYDPESLSRCRAEFRAAAEAKASARRQSLGPRSGEPTSS